MAFLTFGMNTMPILPGKPKKKTPKGYGRVARALNSGPKKKYGKNKYSRSQRMR